MLEGTAKVKQTEILQRIDQLLTILRMLSEEFSEVSKALKSMSDKKKVEVSASPSPTSLSRLRKSGFIYLSRYEDEEEGEDEYYPAKDEYEYEYYPDEGGEEDEHYPDVGERYEEEGDGKGG